MLFPVPAVQRLHCHLFFADTETPSTPRSPCEKQRIAALQESSDTFIPYCRPDGSFDPIQCQGLMCYCVDSDGSAIEGTDKPRPTRPDCEGRCYIFLGCLNRLLPYFSRLILTLPLYKQNRSKCCFIELFFVLDDVEDVAEHFTCILIVFSVVF